MEMKRPEPPTKEIFARATEVHSCLENTIDYSGKILDQEGNILWQFETHPRRSPHSWANLRDRPSFIVSDADGSEKLRVSRGPRRREYIIQQEGTPIGTIRLLSWLRNDYSIHFHEGRSWQFRMPLFSVHFYGVASDGERIWTFVGPRTKTIWNTLFPEGVYDLPLAASLSFIHRQWWCYS